MSAQLPLFPLRKYAPIEIDDLIDDVRGMCSQPRRRRSPEYPPVEILSLDDYVDRVSLAR
jgi:hypothetical protein